MKRLIEKGQKLKICRPLRDYSNPFEQPGWKFIQKYRLSKAAARFLINELSPHLTAAPNGMSVELQVRFYVFL